MAAPGHPPERFRRNIASLVGGFVIAAGVFVLWMLVTGAAGWTGVVPLVAGIAVAALVGAYIRLADL
ncbi:MAG: hypothetical protein IT561_10690 [Alphaproteobacteria bacterium]|nr:hypothetical protein [Alphaproteobacteria bacterium]